MISSRERGLFQLLATAQITAVAFCFWFWYLLLFLFRQEGFPMPQNYAKYFIVVMVALIFESLTRPHSLRMRPGRMRRLAWPVSRRQTVWIVGGMFALQVFSKDYGLSRVFLAGFIALSFAVLFYLNRNLARVSQFVFSRFMKEWKIRTIILGTKKWCDSIRPELEKASALVDVKGEIRIDDSGEIGRQDLLGKVADSHCDLLVMPPREFDDETVMALIAQGDRNGYRCWLPVELTRRFGRRFSIQKIGRLDILSPPVEPLENTLNLVLKRTVDMALSLVVCLTVLPVCCVFVWILHRLFSPGPLFFMQQRVGRNGKPFQVYKFRSLNVDNGNEANQVTRGDDRLYTGARFIRKTSLDEFPQFLNVLSGEMSVVGPRPHMEEHDKVFAEIYEKYGHRRYVKPGVTGLAQVKGYRGEVTDRLALRHRANLDRFYVSNWHLGLDFKIIFLTAFAVISPPKSAY